MINMSYLMVY